MCSLWQQKSMSKTLAFLFSSDSSSSSVLCIPSTSIRWCRQGTVTETHTYSTHTVHSLLSLTSCVLLYTALWGWLWTQSLYCQWGRQCRWENWKEVCNALFNIKILILRNAYHFTRIAISRVFHRDTCRLIIRKIQYAPEKPTAGPKTVISKQFITADKPIHLEASMEKEVGCMLQIYIINSVPDINQS